MNWPFVHKTGFYLENMDDDWSDSLFSRYVLIFYSISARFLIIILRCVLIFFSFLSRLPVAIYVKPKSHINQNEKKPLCGDSARKQIIPKSESIENQPLIPQTNIPKTPLALSV